MTYPNTYFQIVSLVYILFLGVLFYFRKKEETAENHVFRQLIFIGIVSAVFDIMSVYIGHLYPDSLISIIVCKIYLYTLIGYCAFFTEYTYIITRSSDNPREKLEMFQNVRKYFIVIGLLFCIVITLVPCYVYSEDIVYYSYGPAPTVAYIAAGLSIGTWIGLLVFNRKHITFKRALPVLTMLVFGSLGVIIQFNHPELLLVTTAGIFSIVVMYHTVFSIENPDTLMLNKLKAAKDQADHANQAKTDFLSNMSHEIRTPLNAILGFSQGLLEQNLEPQVKEDIEDISTAADALLEIVNEILDISKIESEKLELVEVEYSTEKVYKYLVTMTEGRIGSRDLEFDYSCDDNMPPVLFGDATRIKQIAVNLLTNSVKYTKEGFVRLRFGYEIIDVDNCNLIISVSDSGIGIKKEVMGKLFSRYERFDLDKNNDIEGTGLGLSLTKKLVDMMQGKIEVESEYGKGSTFTVQIPQKIKKASDIKDDAPAPSTFEGHGERILIVDDNSVNLKVVERLLKPYHLNIDMVKSGKECISKISSEEPYDLVLLDDLMPEMSGIETLNILRKDEDYHVPTVVLTANSESGIKQKYMNDGFDDYLGKPIDKILLEELLNKYLNKSSEMKENKRVITKEKYNREFLIKEGIDFDTASEQLGGESLYHELAFDFINSAEKDLVKLKKFYDDKDMQNYHTVIHSWLSDCRYLGFTNLAKLSYQMETASRNNDYEYVSEHYNEFVNSAEKMIDIMKRYLGK